MIFPRTTASSVSLSDLVTRYNYWRDDDGDELAANGVSGNISASFTDKDGNDVSFNEALSACKAPYRVTLSSTGGYLQTQYGVPNRTNFSGKTVTYYINPYGGACVSRFVRYVRPSLLYGGTGILSDDVYEYAGPSNIWSRTRGFVTQSTSSSSYGRNFPTTGADGLYFDLEMPTGVDGSQLTWSVVTNGSITAIVRWTRPYSTDDWISDTSKYVTRVALINPRQLRPSLPQTFELVGRDSRGNEVKYGFVLKQWFVHRDDRDTQSNQSTWCRSLGYHLPRVRDVTNAKCGAMGSWFPCVNGIDGATPSSGTVHYKRYIGAGFFTEWGDVGRYADAGLAGTYWTSDAAGSDGFYVRTPDGAVARWIASHGNRGLCVTP